METRCGNDATIVSLLETATEEKPQYLCTSQFYFFAKNMENKKVGYGLPINVHKLKAFRNKVIDKRGRDLGRAWVKQEVMIDFDTIENGIEKGVLSKNSIQKLSKFIKKL